MLHWYFQCITTTSVTSHWSWAGGARCLWHISILATDSILLACRCENKTTDLDTGAVLFVLSLKPPGNYFKCNTTENMFTTFFTKLSNCFKMCVCVCVYSLFLFFPFLAWGFFSLEVMALIWAQGSVCVCVCVSLQCLILGIIGLITG